MVLTGLLEELRAALIERGCDVDQHLMPGISPLELREEVRPLGLRLPDEVMELYAWRGGQGEEAEMAVDALRFRDNVFIDIPSSLRTYEEIQQYRSAGIEYGFDLGEAFPFAAFMGASYAVICGEHRLASPAAHPVVSFFEGVDLFFHSLETMVSTCIEWVRHPGWSKESELSQDTELEIWLRHNPGVF